MTQIWIVHRRERERAALTHLAAEAEAVSGAPADPRFDTAAAPEVVVLGLADDWEAELEFAHRQRRRLGGARWVLVGDGESAEAVRARFDQLSFEYLGYPPAPAALRAHLEGAAPTAAPALSERAWRDGVSERFSRWLADLELPDLLRALDPRLAEVPLLVRGEPGTGRGALVRYVHAFGGTAGGGLAHVVCEADSGVAEICRALAGSAGGSGPLCIWLDELGRLAPGRQRELAAWLEAGAPGAPAAPLPRWVASIDPAGPALAASLESQLGTLAVHLPPLRERGEQLESIARETAAVWARDRRESPRGFDAGALAALREYPWPGNLRELEGVLLASLAHTRADPIGADALCLPGARAGTQTAARSDMPTDADEPIEAASVGVLLPDGDPPADAPEREALPAPPPRPAGPEAAVAASEDESLRRLASALSRQVRNPLATLRRFAELLPERFDDPEFRHRFAEMLREDVGQIDGLLERVDQLGALDTPRREKVDLAALLESLLEGRREQFRARHLLVLKELDPGQSLALADPEHMRVAFEALLDKALSMVPERGDLYLASRRHGDADASEPAIRVLLRFHDPAARDSRPASEHSLELLIAELLVRAQGGRLTLGASDAEERLLVVDLPAPA